MTSHLSIDYDEDVEGSYRAVVLKLPSGEEKRFASGDPQADWAAYHAYARDQKLMVIESSSVTHFCFDNAEWRFALNEAGYEMLVPEDRPEWTNADPGA
ncbi:hypothetical protein [Pseudosulfitobacter pseudonitzschiae]|uniref:hypothetical protein n=1 Tax=Pseudosulfitobacter pseudonitzschiae TaxID=1402135 RepID=UPI003B7FC68A